MAIVHSTATRNGIADYVVDQIDTGTGAGTLEFQTAADAEIATLIFSATAFGAAAAGVATAAAITSDTTANAGTIAKARIKKGTSGVEVLNCSVTATGGGGDIQLSSVVISAGQTVAVSSLTYTAPA